MSKDNKNEKNDRKFASILQILQDDIFEVLKSMSFSMSKIWGKNIEFKPSRIASCRPSRFCINRCENYCLCQNYRQFRDFFLKLGYIVYPYILFREGLPLKIIESSNFSDERIRKVLFINSACFYDINKDNFFYSALNATFLCFFIAISLIASEYNQILASINHDDLIKFLSNPSFQEFFFRIYGKRRIIPQNELIAHYIANNPDTKEMLEAIFMGDKEYQPPDVLRDLYVQLNVLFDSLEVGGNA